MEYSECYNKGGEYRENTCFFQVVRM